MTEIIRTQAGFVQKYNMENIEVQPTTISSEVPQSNLQPTNTPSKPKNSRIIFIGLALILFGILLGILAGRFLPMSNIVENTTPTPTIEVSVTPTPTADPTANWTTVNLKNCSTRHTDFEYTLKVPSDWTFKKVQENTGRTVSSLTNKLGSSLEINRDTAGIGSVICTDGGVIDNPFNTQITTQNGCFWSADSKVKTYGAQYTIGHQFGSFVFRSTGVEKTLLDQILSTFKFTNSEITIIKPSSGSTIQSPVTITGTAPKGWTFEAMITIVIEDSNHKKIAGGGVSTTR